MISRGLQQEAAQAVVAALAQDFQAVLSELINAKKIELVVTPQSLFYAKPELDITDDVTSGLDVRLAKNLKNNLINAHSYLKRYRIINRR